MTKVAMVTGASSGIGEAFAERLAADAYDLVVVARREDRLGELKVRLENAHGVRVTAIRADLGQRHDLQRVCDEIAAVELDVLVNNAGLAHYMGFAELSAVQASELVDVNVLAPVLLARTAVTGMVARGRGSIINVASLLAFSGPVEAAQLPQRAVYAATKSFLVTFSEVLAHELRASGVHVQVVCPGLVRSEFHTRQGMDMNDVPRMEPQLVVEASRPGEWRGRVDPRAARPRRVRPPRGRRSRATGGHPHHRTPRALSPVLRTRPPRSQPQRRLEPARRARSASRPPSHRPARVGGAACYRVSGAWP